jgi:hypothetical protein
MLRTRLGRLHPSPFWGTSRSVKAVSVKGPFDGQPPNCPPTHVDDGFPDT